MQRPVLLATSLSLLVACGEEKTAPISPSCPDAATLGFLELSALTAKPWFYRRSVIAGEGPFLGTGDLARINFHVEGRELVAVREGSAELAGRWMILRHVDLGCEGGVSLVSGAEAGGKYLEVDWNARSSELQFEASVEGFEISFTESNELAEWRKQSASYLEITERGNLTANTEVCETFWGGFDPPRNCGGNADVRHAFRVIDAESFTEKAAAQPPKFSLHTIKDRLQRARAGQFIFYLSTDFPAAVSSVGISESLASALPGAEIRPNDCRPEGIARALAAAPELASLVGADAAELRGESLIAACNSLENAAPNIFTWQRPGDLRSRLIEWTEPARSSKWGSHASRAVDAGTGEIVASTLYLDGTKIQSWVEKVMDRVESTLPGPTALIALAQARAMKMRSSHFELSAETASILTAGALSGESTEAALTRYALVEGTAAELVASNGTAAVFLLGPNYERGDPIPVALQTLSTPRERAEAALDREGRERAAALFEAGYSFLDRLPPEGFEAIALELLAIEGEDSRAILLQNLSSHLMIQGLAQSLGLALNPAGSSSEHSVMDVFHGDRIFQETLFREGDIAALKYLYFDATPANNFAGCTVREALLHPTPHCAVFDEGANAREIFADKYWRWLGTYTFTHIIDNPDTFDAARAFRPALELLEFGSIAAAWLGNQAATDPSFRGSAFEQDLFDAVNLTANFAMEVLSIPEAGRACPWQNATPRTYLPNHVLNCVEEDFGSPEAIAAEMIEIVPGLGRDAVWSREANGGPWRRIGVEVDRSNVLLMLDFPFPAGLANGAPRLTVERTLSVSEELFARILRSDPYLIDSNEVVDRGSFWCRDQGASRPDLGHIETRRAVAENGTRFPGPSENCLDPSYVHSPASSGIIRGALAGIFMNTNKDLAIYEVGADDQTVDWGNYAPEELCEALTLEGRRYRAVRSEMGVECLLVQRVEDWKQNYQATGEAFYRDIYLYHRDMIEAARTLRSIFRPVN
jgi:hypothetical protein